MRRRALEAAAVEAAAMRTTRLRTRSSGVIPREGVPILRTTKQTGKKQQRRRKQGGRIAAILVAFSLLQVLLLSLLPAASAASSSSHHSSSSSRHRHHRRRKGRDQRRDYYDVLGADKHCTPEQLKKCYRKACLLHHPDKGGDEDEFKRVARAYQVLSDPQQRKLYDALGEAGLEQQPQQPGGGAGTSGNPFTGGPFGGPGFTSFSFGGSSSAESPFSASSFFRQHSTSTGGGGGGGGGGGVHLNVEDLLRELMMGAGGPHGGVGGAGGGRSRSSFRDGSRGGSFRRRPPASTTYERPVHCSLEELYSGATKKLKVSFDKAKKVSQLYNIYIKPGYKEGTKITFPATASGPQMVFVIQEKPHPVFQRRGDDLVYHYKLGSYQPQQRDGRIQLSIPLLDGTTWTRDIDMSSSVVRRGGSITVPNLGMPVRRRRTSGTGSGNDTPKRKVKGDGSTRDEGERGNLVIEFE